MRPQFRRPGRRGVRALALAALLALAACHRNESAAPGPRPVVAVAVHPDGHAPAAVLPGEIAARDTTPLSFRVAGKILDRRVRLGDRVTRGEVVARLDPADAQKNAASTQAQLDAAEHNLAYAKQQLARDQAQASAHLIAAAQLEQTTNAYAAALGQRDQAAQQAALARDQLRYTDLVADHAGVISDELAQTGQNVSAGEAVYNLAWSGATDVVVDVPETVLAGLAVGQRAQVTLTALPAHPFAAQVRELAPVADPQSRTWRVKLTLVDPTPAVHLGMTASVAFAPAEPAGGTTFTLPATALFHDGPNPAVWVVSGPDNVLQLHRVQVVRYDAGTVTLAGLKDGERVVLQGVHTVSAGEKVHPVAPLDPEDITS
jgi:multidrug efflux system membrane fusion protein